MALVGNFTALQKTPGRFFGGQEGQYRSNFSKSNSLQNFAYQSGAGTVLRYVSVPPGNEPPYAWDLPIYRGAISSHYLAAGSAAVAAVGALGMALDTSISAPAVMAAVGQLVVSAAATIAAEGLVSGNVLAALMAAADLVAAGQASAAATAIADAVAILGGSAEASVSLRADGELSALLATGEQSVLTAPSIAGEILDAQMVETGLTVRETLRLCAAALAGKISGADGAEIVIRSAVADDAERITATVDAHGNRTGITYGLG